ncbi:hypothetical protein CIPAW_16G097300 [Carya illinoinensis]|uniref:Uncharacterized protein n=1 Tax=Carya illinoinensis TaxID=32201 RepID=A0A8T1N9J0_CARIL|nr:hypothetical protein CIPAW_16G097300 [Carya illinoinensis]
MLLIFISLYAFELLTHLRKVRLHWQLNYTHSAAPISNRKKRTMNCQQEVRGMHHFIFSHSEPTVIQVLN